MAPVEAPNPKPQLVGFGIEGLGVWRLGVLIFRLRIYIYISHVKPANP